jgi:hypothetical protein
MTMLKSSPEKRPVTAPAVSSGGAAASTDQRPIQSPAAKAEKPLPPGAGAKPEKPLKSKMVRDRFCMPKSEYRAIGQLKQRLAKLGLRSKKNALLRAGLKSLSAMSDSVLIAALAALGPEKASASGSAKSAVARAAPKADSKPASKGKRGKG